MYALLNEDQLALRDAVAELAKAIGIDNPADLDDHDPAKAWGALEQMGLLELRVRESGRPTASGVEVMVVAEALGARLVPVPYLPAAVLATELLARAGAPPEWTAEAGGPQATNGLLLRADLTGLAGPEEPGALVWGGPQVHRVLAVDTAADARLVRLTIDAPITGNRSADLTQGMWALPRATTEPLDAPLEPDALASWTALALAGLCADTVGVMRQALTGVTAYAKERIAYGVPIGSFQAVQHLAADTHVAIEAAYGATCYAAWCVDAVDADTALLAARTAKAYCASVARSATENVMQIYGGIGQTWEHPAHVYTRRALLDTVLLGAEEHQLDRIAAGRLGKD